MTSRLNSEVHDPATGQRIVRAQTIRDAFQAALARCPKPPADLPNASPASAEVIVQHLRTKDDQLAYAELLCLAIEGERAADPMVKFFGEHATTELFTLSDDAQYEQLLWLVNYCRSDRPVQRNMVWQTGWPLHEAYTRQQAGGHRPRRTPAATEIEEDDADDAPATDARPPVAAFAREDVDDAGQAFLYSLRPSILSLVALVIPSYTDGRASSYFDIRDIEEPIATLILGVSRAHTADEDDPLHTWKHEATTLPTLLGLPGLVGRSLGIWPCADGQSTNAVDVTGLSSAVNNILLCTLPAILGELSRHPAVSDSHQQHYGTKLATIQRKCLPPARASTLDQPRAGNVRDRLDPPLDARERPAPRLPDELRLDPPTAARERLAPRLPVERITLDQLRRRHPDINDDLERLIDDGTPHPAVAAASSLPPRTTSGARVGGRGGSAGWDAMEDDSAATMPSARLYFGPKPSDILYPINFTERNKAEPGVEQGVRLKIDTETGATEFFTAKSSAGKRPLSALEMMGARETIRLKCCDNIRANRPPSWSAAKLEATIARFNESYARYIHGTLMPHYNKHGSNETMLRAIQDFDAKLFSEIYLGHAQLDEPNSFNYLVVEKIYSVLSTPAPRPGPAADQPGAVTCRHYNQPRGCWYGDSCTKIHRCSSCGSTSHNSASCHKRSGTSGGAYNSGGGGGGRSGGGGGQRKIKADHTDRADGGRDRYRADGSSDRYRGRR